MSLVFKQKVDGAIGIPFLTLCALLVLESTVLWILGLQYLLLCFFLMFTQRLCWKAFLAVSKGTRCSKKGKKEKTET